MATTILRFVWNNDSGTPEDPVGDGTTVNNAELQKIFDAIDALLANPLTLGDNLTLEGGTLTVVGNETVSGTLTVGRLAPTLIQADAAAVALYLRGRPADNIARLLFLNNAGTVNHAAIDGATGELRFSTGTLPALRMTINATGDIKVEAPGGGHDFAAAAGNALVARIRGRAVDGFARLLYRDSADTVTHAAIDGAPNLLRFLTGTTPSIRLTIDDAAITPAVRVNSSPVQPGFLAYNSATDTGVLGGTAITFDTEVYDHAGNFNGTTFTAPVAGIYAFNVQVAYANVVGGIFTLILQTSNRNYHTSSPQLVAATSVFADMDAGDTAQVTFAGATSADITGTATMFTRFSGRLMP